MAADDSPAPGRHSWMSPRDASLHSPPRTILDLGHERIDAPSPSGSPGSARTATSPGPP
jgi:hypothetical protein